MNPREPLFYLLAILAACGFALAPYLIFCVSPVDPQLGLIQKIFFFHVPCAWAMFLAALFSAIGAIAFLFKGRPWGDALGASASELTVVFGILVMITGPLWAKKAWGQYWVWDVRLTTVFILLMIYCAVLLARRFGGVARRRIAAGLAIFGAADVPLVYVSVKLWRTVHPETTVVRSLPPTMMMAFGVSLLLFTILFLLLLQIRLRLEKSRQRLDDLYLAASEGE
jgi:heme exporter protein C